MIIYVPEFGFSAGSETVVLKVTSRWVDEGHDIVMAAPRYRLRRYRQRGLDSRVRTVELGWRQSGWQRWVGAMANRLSDASRWRGHLLNAALRLQVRHEKATHVFVPWIVNQPVINFGLPTGVMVMDLAWRHYPPGWFGVSMPVLDRALENWLQKATVAFPVSESTASEIKDAFPKISAELATVPHGSEWRGSAKVSDESPGLYFLTPAGLTPNKDHAGLFQAAMTLWREGLDFKLVWTGVGTEQVLAATKAETNEGQRLQCLYQTHHELVAGRLECLGFVSDQELDSLYAGACRVVLPSTYEGFGLPVLEAIERCVRVICTDIPAFREQVARYQMNERVVIVAKNNPAALAAAIQSAIRDGPDARNSVDEVDLRRRIEAWTWGDAAQRYLKVLGRSDAPMDRKGKLPH
jgi:glycosyltransferase involved in cell wall biosynthesis